MKIRIQGYSIRLRLSQSEVAKFHETGKVADGIRFGNEEGAALNYVLERSDLPEMAATFAENRICVFVPSGLASTWATAEQEVGMEHLVRFPSSDGYLRILVEKDFKCLADRPSEDDSDGFPNPNLSC
ncbi:MAG: hypothetical protein IPM82_09240 [Saprospiraceae bacterium]|nr:hypothetical protein [Saprospiraceae bacterium]